LAVLEKYPGATNFLLVCWPLKVFIGMSSSEYEKKKIVLGVPLRRKRLENSGLDPEMYGKYKDISWARETPRSPILTKI
jgi:hypothetical protein